MSKILPILIHNLTREYRVLRDIYILMEEGAWLTNLALENDDQDYVNLLGGQRAQYNQFVKDREKEIKSTEHMLTGILGWEEFSIHRLLSEIENCDLEELGKTNSEIQTIICSMARIDTVNFLLQKEKTNAGNEKNKLAATKKRAEKAYQDSSFMRSL